MFVHFLAVLTEQKHEIKNFCVFLAGKLRQPFSQAFTLNPTLKILHSHDMPMGRCRTVRNSKRMELLTKFLGKKKDGFFGNVFLMSPE